MTKSRNVLIELELQAPVVNAWLLNAFGTTFYAITCVN